MLHLMKKKNNSRKTIIFYFLKSFLCRESFLTISKHELNFLEGFSENLVRTDPRKKFKKWLVSCRQENVK